jgi:hypothetical protein
MSPVFSNISAHVMIPLIKPDCSRALLTGLSWQANRGREGAEPRDNRKVRLVTAKPKQKYENKMMPAAT